MTTPTQPMTLQDHFLIAMPTLTDANFQNTVIYVCEHSENGAIGIILNRPTTLSLADVLGDMKIQVQDDTVKHIPVLFGGPIHQERGFVVHRPKGTWRSTLETGQEIFITTSRDVLEALAVHQGPDDVLIALGCVAWEPGQLEQELKANQWLSVSATPNITFDTPFELRYAEGLALLGVNLAHLSDEAGHA